MILEISWFAGYWLFGENDVEAGEGGALKCPISVSCGHITDCHKFNGLKGYTSALPLCGTAVHISLPGLGRGAVGHTLSQL